MHFESEILKNMCFQTKIYWRHLAHMLSFWDSPHWFIGNIHHPGQIYGYSRWFHVHSKLNCQCIIPKMILSAWKETFAIRISRWMQTVSRHTNLSDDKKWNSFFNIHFELATKTCECFITFEQSRMNCQEWKNVYSFVYVCERECYFCCCLIVSLYELTTKFATQSVRRYYRVVGHTSLT